MTGGKQDLIGRFVIMVVDVFISRSSYRICAYNPRIDTTSVREFVIRFT